MTSIPVIIALTVAILGALGAVFLKKGAPQFHLSLRSIMTNYRLWIGLFLYAASAVLFIGALQFGKLSTLYPLLATAYGWVGIFSVLLLKERMNLLKWVGILLIIGGVSLVGGF